jgi:hypothetical protein
MLFPNMSSEMFYLFLHESSETVVECPGKLVCAEDKHAFATLISPLQRC